MGKQQDWKTHYKYFPKVLLERNKCNFYINMVYSNHGIFPVFQASRFQGNPTCWCGEAEGTSNHLIYDCKKVEDLRTKYFPKNFKEVDLNLTLITKKTRQGVMEILQHFAELAIPRN